jgi:D-ribose pyranase
MGHYDNLLITDAGFPIPKNIPCVDLSIRGNIPTVIEIAELLSIELEVEEFFIANEVEAHFRNRKEAINIYFPEAKGHLLPHSELKKIAQTCRAVIRTGDFTPYANVILSSGVIY